jgi:hypothetical protein
MRHTYVEGLECEHIPRCFLKVGLYKIIAPGEEQIGGGDPAKSAFEKEANDDHDDDQSALRLESHNPGPCHVVECYGVSEHDGGISGEH